MLKLSVIFLMFLCGIEHHILKKCNRISDIFSEVNHLLRWILWLELWILVAFEANNNLSEMGHKVSKEWLIWFMFWSKRYSRISCCFWRTRKSQSLWVVQRWTFQLFISLLEEWRNIVMDRRKPGGCLISFN